MSGYINFKKRNPYAHADPDYEATKTPTTVIDWENNKMNIFFEKNKAALFKQRIKRHDRERMLRAHIEKNKPPPVVVQTAPVTRPRGIGRQRMITPPSSHSGSSNNETIKERDSEQCIDVELVSSKSIVVEKAKLQFTL